MIPDVAPTLNSRWEGGGGLGTDFDINGGLVPQVANPLTARMFKGVNTTMDEGQTMIGEPLVFDETQITHPENRSVPRPGAPSHALASGARPPAIAFNARQDPIHSEIALPLDTGGSTQGVAVEPLLAWQNRFRGDDGRGYTRAPTAMEGVAGTLDTVKPWHIATRWVVRRLTPTECERLQGFPDGFTNIPWRGKNGSPDGPRYKALGNSMAVNVMRWLGRRIEMVDAIPK